MAGPPTKVGRALISVHDKSGIVEFAAGLVELGIDIVSSGGTAARLEEGGVPVRRVESITSAPEMLGGRVKTLHPLVHGAILADRGSKEHLTDVKERGIELIDLVVVNLYPFEATVATPGVTEEEAIEQIDIGGPAMIRAAAKNHHWVGVVTSREQYDGVLSELRESGGLSNETRTRLARTAFALTAAYDSAIVDWISRGEELPDALGLALTKELELRYGENPHQSGAFYAMRSTGSLLSEMDQLGGKELSFNNISDLDAAMRLVAEFSDPAAVIVKHANPCGVAVAYSIEDAYRRANDCDPQSAFGGVVALNRTASADLAESLAEIFTEVVVAPAFDDQALEALRSQKNLRIMRAAAGYATPQREFKSALGGMLVQSTDELDNESNWKVVSQVEPSAEQLADLKFAWTVCAHTKSNAIVLAKDGQAFGVGAGDQSRVGAAERAAERAAGRAEGGVAASEAFFPFRDGLDAVVAAGARAVVEPGGSVRDDEVVAAADEHGVALVFTGRRHFRHA